MIKKIGILTDRPPIFNGGFSQRIKREISLISKIDNMEIYLLSFCSLSATRMSKKEIENLLRKEPIDIAEVKFIVSSRLNICSIYDKYYIYSVKKWIEDKKIEVVFCENLWCGYIGAKATRYSDTKCIFDYHGVVPEEAVFLNICKEGDRKYHYYKKIEKYAIENSNKIICVSHKFKEYITQTFEVNKEKIYVVPCCVMKKQNRFSYAEKETMKSQLGLTNKKVVLYAGSITKYQCIDEMVWIFNQLYRNNHQYFFLFLSAYDNYAIVEKLMKKYELPNDCFMLKSVAQEEVYSFCCVADYGMLIRNKHILNKVCSPTKLAEYLEAGLPIIGTTSIGDIDEIPTQKVLFDYDDIVSHKNIYTKIEDIDIGQYAREKNYTEANDYLDKFYVWDAYFSLYKKLVGEGFDESN